MDFRSFCDFLQTVKDTKGYAEKGKIITDQLHKFRDLIIATKPETKETVFPLLRLMLPKLDRERSSYNMKESKIARTLTKMLDLPQGNDRNLLTKSYLSVGACDFGDVVYSVLRKYIASYQSQLTIQELNLYLDDISKRKSESEAEEIMLKIFKKSSPEDSKWVIRIILKDLKLGIDGNRILNCFHKDAANFYSTNNNLKKVCEVLSNPNVKLHELEICVFEAFRPMLSKRVDAVTFKRDLVDNKMFFVENKFDGERFQLHMQNNVYKYFSRNGFDFTSHYGATYESGIFTPKLKNLFKDNVSKIILDGEMMLWNKQTRKFGSKGMTFDVKKLNAKGKYQPCFCIYDILLINDKILTNQPLKDRLKVLQKVLTEPIPGTVILSEIKEVNTRQEIIDELNQSMDKEEEGIIVKDPNSIYKYSDRNSGWFKMKLEYFNDVMNDLDLILMGGCYGATSDKLNSFFVGIRSGNNNEGFPQYLSFGKISTGLNDEQLELLDKKFKSQGYKIGEFPQKSKGELLFGKDLPNYWIEPKNSCIFLVRASELIRTTDKSFKTPYTFRFPRVLSVRNDKPVDECLSINELLELSQQNKPVIKLNKRNIDLSEILNTKTRQAKKIKLIVPIMEKTDKISEILDGLTIFVMSGNEVKSKESVENIIRRAGGKVSYVINSNVNIVLLGNYDLKIKKMIADRQSYDIISVGWLQRCLDAGEPVCYNHEEVFCLGCNYKNFLADDLDMYGDSYTEEATEKSLKKTFEIVKDMEEESYQTGNEEIKLLDNSRFYFRKYVAYFDKYEVLNDKNSGNIYNCFVDELEFRYYNGLVSDTFNDTVNLIIFNGNRDRSEIIKNYLISVRRKDVEVVPKTFIYKRNS